MNFITWLGLFTNIASFTTRLLYEMVCHYQFHPTEKMETDEKTDWTWGKEQGFQCQERIQSHAAWFRNWREKTYPPQARYVKANKNITRDGKINH